MASRTKDRHPTRRVATRRVAGAITCVAVLAGTAAFAGTAAPAGATGAPLPEFTATATSRGARLTWVFANRADTVASGGVVLERWTDDNPSWNEVHTYTRPTRRKSHVERWFWLGPLHYRACLAAEPTRCTEPATVMNDGSYGQASACGDAVDAGVIADVNAFRRQHGVAPVRDNALFNQAANERAAYVARLGRLDGHAGVPAAVAATGYRARWVGEWLHWYISADRVVGGWIGSAAHRDAMLWTFVTEVGIGCARGRDGGLYWSMISALPG